MKFRKFSAACLALTAATALAACSSDDEQDDTAATNTEALGRVLYTDYVYAFQIAGLILLVAMIGAIVLTLRDRPGVKRQNISVQNARTQTMAVETRKVPSRQGVEV